MTGGAPRRYEPAHGRHASARCWRSSRSGRSTRAPRARRARAAASGRRPTTTSGRAFQRDRDRLLHCKAFRRLAGKTQVFLAPKGDHYRTRLTHTLEVAQVARSIARALRLNEMLVEAMVMGHDLGHTPFGHAGERLLNEVVAGGFHHVVQSVRVVEVLENDGRGAEPHRRGARRDPPPLEGEGERPHEGERREGAHARGGDRAASPTSSRT